MTSNTAKAAALVLALAAVWAGPTSAQNGDIGTLAIEAPYLRAPPPRAPVAGGYVVIRNTGAESDRLVEVTAGFAAVVQIHNMSLADGVMKMRLMPDGLEIPAGDTVALEPGGAHLMFMQLSEQLMAGEQRAVTLTFEKAGEVDIIFDIRPFAPKDQQGDGSGS
ncbi:MAG: copper chaperone PCu(A)C [Alphaproteobacteria bacterium]